MKKEKSFLVILIIFFTIFTTWFVYNPFHSLFNKDKSSADFVLAFGGGDGGGGGEAGGGGAGGEAGGGEAGGDTGASGGGTGTGPGSSPGETETVAISLEGGLIETNNPAAFLPGSKVVDYLGQGIFVIDIPSEGAESGYGDYGGWVPQQPPTDQCPAGTYCSETIPPGYCSYGTCSLTRYETRTETTYQTQFRIIGKRRIWEQVPVTRQIQVPVTYSGYCIKPCPVVTNNPPSATNLRKDDPDWCINPFQFRLNWTFTDPDGDSQAAKQIQLDNNSNFSSIDHDSGKVENNVQAYTTFMTDGQGGVLQFNKSYYWRLKVWDSRGAESSWIIAHWIVAPQTLNTPRHAYPDPNFTWQPLRPIAGDSVQFTDQSIASGGARIVRWSWTFQDGNPPTSFSQNPLVIFGGGEGAKKVQLTVWDTDNYSCPVEKEVNIGIFAPIWREIAPW